LPNQEEKVLSVAFRINAMSQVRRNDHPALFIQRNVVLAVEEKRFQFSIPSRSSGDVGNLTTLREIGNRKNHFVEQFLKFGESLTDEPAFS